MIFGKKNKHSAVNDAAQNPSHETTRILAMVAEDYLKEKKQKRRWGLFFKLAIGAYLLVVLSITLRSQMPINVSEVHTAVVRIEGVIGQDPLSTSPQVNEALRKAFAAENSRGVVLKINSPGGTPVQSDEVNQEITRLRAQYPNKPIYAVVSDLCASGGYYIAAATEQIYANPASIVGSIGVRMGGFGFVDTMQKLGVERRLITAGSNKGMLDPFSPANPSEINHAEVMLSQVHQQFIDAVKRGRGERLSQDPDIFSGLFWSGEEAKRLGLVDDFGDTHYVAREKFAAEKLVDYTMQTSLLEQFGQKFGASLSAGFASKLWSKLMGTTQVVSY